MYVPGSQIGSGAFTEVFVFDSSATAWRGSQRRLLSATGLNTAFFVRRDDELTRMERASVPNAIEDLVLVRRRRGSSHSSSADP